MTLGQGWMIQEVNEDEAKYGERCGAGQFNYQHTHIELLETFASESEDYLRYFR